MANTEMNEHQRLVLIIEAVKYCKKVRGMGMPSSCYSKALREPIFFLWEKRRAGDKYEIAKYRSVNSVGVEKGKNLLRYDHSIPFKLIQEELLSLEVVNSDTVKEILENRLMACTITKEEDDKLRKAGLQSKMPEDWDNEDPLARYKKVGIEVILNS